MNKKGNTLAVVGTIFGVCLLFGIIMLGSLAGTYNSLVVLDTNTENSWAKVQTAYERRADLIPNLVGTVKGVVKFEQETQTQIAALRSGISNANNPQEMNKVGKEMNSLISGIMINVEAYPDLKASENFLALQDELAGTENRIKWERDNYNDAVAEYKVAVRSFPTNMVAGIFNFERSKWDMFDAEEGSENPVEVDF